jgi:hypothetical protein
VGVERLTAVSEVLVVLPVELEGELELPLDFPPVQPDRWADDRSWDQKPLPPNLNRGRRLGRQAATMPTAASVQVHMATGAWLSVQRWVSNVDEKLGLTLLTSDIRARLCKFNHGVQANDIEDQGPVIDH